ncbi:hypothetical protein ILYODFUR_035965, partial [Ilyodon furcidens]
VILELQYTPTTGVPDLRLIVDALEEYLEPATNPSIPDTCEQFWLLIWLLDYWTPNLIRSHPGSANNLRPSGAGALRCAG